MILLLGGTSEAGRIAAALEKAGIGVVVSTATGLASSVRESRLVRVRTGMLNEAGLSALIRECGARAVVDATHPYAVEISRNARLAAGRAVLPLLRFLREPAVTGKSEADVADDHEEAARRAFASGRPVLLTIGTRHLAPYLRAARAAGVPVFARVLPAPESREACERAGLPAANLIAGRGPFSVEENLALIRRLGIGVLVTKDGGAAGGVPEKLEAARRAGCTVVVVARPAEGPQDGALFRDLQSLVSACTALGCGEPSRGGRPHAQRIRGRR